MPKTATLPRARRADAPSEVMGCGYLHKNRQHACHDRDLQAYALVYVIDGGGYYADQNTPAQRITAGDVLVLFPGLRHSYYLGDQPTWTEIWLTFRGRLFAELERDGLLDRARPVVHPGLDQELLAAFDRMHAEAGRDDWRLGPSLVAGAHQLIAEVMRGATSPASRWPIWPRAPAACWPRPSSGRCSWRRRRASWAWAMRPSASSSSAPWAVRRRSGAS